MTDQADTDEGSADRVRTSARLDKWLWAARFFKTRSLAQQAIELGRVRIQGARLKPAHTVRAGEELQVAIGDSRIDVVVRAVATQRGPAPVARLLYEETAASIARREQRQQLRARGPEPALSIKGRPTKKQGRELRRLRGGES